MSHYSVDVRSSAAESEVVSETATGEVRRSPSPTEIRSTCRVLTATHRGEMNLAEWC